MFHSTAFTVTENHPCLVESALIRSRADCCDGFHRHGNVLSSTLCTITRHVFELAYRIQLNEVTVRVLPSLRSIETQLLLVSHQIELRT